MRLLLLGGSWLLGRLIAADSIGRGFEVTVFNRGRGRSPLPDQVHELQGDRTSDDDLRRLATFGPWDTIIDISGKIPALVGRTVRTMADLTSRYVSVSSVAVYRDFPSAAVDEDSPLLPGDPTFDPGPAGWDLSQYGTLKVGCELACRDVLGADRLLVVRLHAMIGQYEDTDAVQFWLQRLRRGGAVLLPRPDRPLQAIDVRDVARFLVDQIERGTTGVFNIGARAEERMFGALIRACTEAVGAKPELVWTDPEWLLRQGVRCGQDLPLWDVRPGMWSVSVERALAAGLESRPFAETAADTWRWLKDDRRPEEKKRFKRLGLDPSAEAELIARWQRRSG